MLGCVLPALLVKRIIQCLACSLDLWVEPQRSFVRLYRLVYSALGKIRLAEGEVDPGDVRAKPRCFHEGCHGAPSKLP